MSEGSTAEVTLHQDGRIRARMYGSTHPPKLVDWLTTVIAEARATRARLGLPTPKDNDGYPGVVGHHNGGQQ